MGEQKKVGALPPDVRYRWMTYDAGRAEAWTAVLSEEERQRRRGFGSAKRQREFTLGRVAARLLLAEELDFDPEQVPLRTADNGAVELEGVSRVVSIAHAGPHAVAAVAPRRLGVDLERIQERHPDLPRFFLHPDERDLLEHLPLEHTPAVILCWTLKEAALKARRTGLRCSPKTLRLDINVAAHTAVVRKEGGELWQACFARRDGFYLTFAYADERHG